MRWAGVALLAVYLGTPADTPAVDPFAVHYSEGRTHGFLVLTTLDGKRIADGDLIQTARGGRVNSRLVFHFKDGSFYDDTTIFTQTRRFQVLSDHLVQKGPSFPEPMDALLDVAKSQITVRYEDDGKEKVDVKSLELPPDVANGMMFTILANLRPSTTAASVSMVAATPKPRVVKLAIVGAGDESFRTGGVVRKATHFVIKVHLGGITGVVAPLVGKQPPDSHVWIYHDGAPGFVRAELPLFSEGPIWRIQTVAPSWTFPSAPQ